METMPIRKLPVGDTGFYLFNRRWFLYVDKTDLVYRMVTTGKPYFLSRPRRFGKACSFRHSKPISSDGKTCSKGLAIEQLEKD